MIHTFLLGILTGFCLSIPIGPINLTVIRESLHHHFRRGFLIGLGGVAADTFYCAMAFLGFSSLLDELTFLWPFLQFAGGIVVLLVGFRYFSNPQQKYRQPAKMTGKSKTYFHKAFPLGFFMGISNFSLFILWGGVNTLLVSNGWIDLHYSALVACVLGISIGSIVWFALIAALVSKMNHQISPRTIAWITQGCGILLIFFGIILCYRTLTNQSVLF